MTRKQTDHFRSLLTDLLPRVEATAAGLEDGARMGVGGDAGGNLSNAPMHLGDLGAAAYAQELDATLLENESYIRGEVHAALDRLDSGTYGTCESCRAAIPAERLDALPYVRFCTPCAAREQSGPAMNLNRGRPAGWSDPNHNSGFGQADPHATGTAGGGTAVGGLAGTNVGGGRPDGADLERAMGSGRFDVEIETDDENPEGYAGPTGGAVGGTPAGKRSSGGRRGHGGRP